MSLLHAEALVLIDQLEERLKMMVVEDPTGSIQLVRIYERSLQAMRGSVRFWYQAVYAPAHPDDPRCLHGVGGCHICFNPMLPIRISDQTYAEMQAAWALRTAIDPDLRKEPS